MSASIIASVVTGGTNSHQTVSEELNNVATDFVAQGIVGAFTSGSPNTGAFAVTQDTGSDMAIAVLSGRAYVSGTPSGQDAQVLSARMTSNYTDYVINANSSGSTKYDWIYLSFSATNASTPDSAADNVITLFTSRSTSNATDNGSPPTYGLLLAVVTVANGATSITNGNITDKRVQSQLSVQSAATTGWQTLGFPLTYGANNGSKEFTVTTPNNLTGVLSPGMKLNITRSVTPPTQCMSFASASSQYATKATPSGVTFTSAFTCEAWVYLNSYTGQAQMIVNRMDSAVTSGGWRMYINSSGQVTVDYGTGSSFTTFVTSQSVILNQWMHVAGVITSTSSKTGAIYINGTSVPTANPNTAATSLTQASVDLRLGAASATPTNTYFNGYMSEVRVWSVAQSAGSIQSNMAINCVGNETNLVALFQGSGNFNDSTSNANNLTQSGGAIATQTNNPYSATEYFSVIAASYSNPNTTLILDGGTQNTLPNQTLNSPNYSTSANPYGLPVNLKRYTRYVPICSNLTTASTSVVQAPGLTATLTIPTGAPTVRITAYTDDLSNTASNNAFITIWQGTVGSGTQLQAAVASIWTGTANVPVNCMAIVKPPSSGSTTYNVGYYGQNAGTTTITAAITNQAYLLIECDL